MTILNRQDSLPRFGRRLRLLRRALDVKQSALSEELGISQSTLSRWEAGVQEPDTFMQKQAFDLLESQQADDAALRRLVESSNDCVHLVDEATHKCLAYSRPRAREWRTSQRAMLGVSLWQFATEEIKVAEQGLEAGDWWAAQHPRPVCFHTSAKRYEQIHISSGGVLWERLYLRDGTPVRLCSLG